MNRSDDTLNNEMHWVVLSYIAQLACSDKDELLLEAGFEPKLIRILKKKSLADIRILSTNLCDTPVIDVAKLQQAIELAQIPKEIQSFLVYGASNKALEHFLGIKGAVNADWRRVVCADPDFRNRSVPDNKYSELWDTLLALPLNDVKDISSEQIVEVAKCLRLSIGSIWSEISNQ
ncbi:hypothetical protein MACH09_46150 [Vibrio sp. MACH09]|uniref:STY4526/YPO1902 family pathogenicity island replication protein n=1 Tax=Vibrio sp. MACH09 TaxID=3025122 RepID=UPI002790FBB6|nr:STY4526/YPO1902 family pathogenicity island replication protein [Vibrio sp. MACH09]GLO64107.1 hypothetical protein MACH09_46150 [Vibrio sp. MACH09]